MRGLEVYYLLTRRQYHAGRTLFNQAHMRAVTYRKPETPLILLLLIRFQHGFSGFLAATEVKIPILYTLVFGLRFRAKFCGYTGYRVTRC